MGIRLGAAAVVLLTILVAPASAVTVDEIIQLSKAGVSEQVILALIDRDKPIFDIQPEQLVALKRQGVSESIVLAMLRSGRAEGELAAQNEAALRTSMILNSLSTEPEVKIVGHGPDTPNTTHYGYSFYPGYDYPAYPAYPLAFGPPAVPIPVPYPAHATPYRRVESHRDRMMCLAQTTGRGAPGGPVASWVTECPAVMQRALNQTAR